MSAFLPSAMMIVASGALLTIRFSVMRLAREAELRVVIVTADRKARSEAAIAAPARLAPAA